MRVVALDAIGRGEWLVLVRLLQVGALDVMTVKAQRWRRFGEVIVELDFAERYFADRACFVRGVAGVAAHVEGGVAAAFGGDIEAGGVASKAEIFFLVAGFGLQQLILIVGSVGVVTLHAIAHGRGMNSAFDVGGIFVGVAG